MSERKPGGGERYAQLQPEVVGLGTKESHRSDNEYTAKLKGVGFLTGDGDSAMLARERYNNQESAGQGESITLLDFFPVGWDSDQEFEYEITIKAKLVDPK